MSVARADVVVIGGGHNGLVCAALLARAGREVVVVERSAAIGGATVSAELTRPGVVHDVLATNVGAFAAGPVHAELGDDLRRHGLEFSVNPNAFASAFPDARALRVGGGLERTLAELEANDPADVAGWRELADLFRAAAPTIFGGLAQPAPSLGWARLARSAWRELGAGRALELLQLLASSPRDFGDSYLHSREAKALLAAWALHGDFGPDQSAGTLLPFLETFADMEYGMALVRGGIGNLPRALAAVVDEAGGRVVTGAEATAIAVVRGRAQAVELAGGERIAAPTVVACVGPRALYGGLLRDAPLPDAVRRAAGRFRYGPGTVMVHLALSGPVPWAAGDDLASYGYVHVGPYVEEMAGAYTEARNGLLPSDPLLVVGQPTAADPSRAPGGEHVLWVQVRAVPAEIRGDAAGDIAATSWDEAIEPYADRVLAKLERYAPGVGGLVLDRAALSPLDIEARDSNLVGGDNGAGSGLIAHNLVFRPLPGWSRHRTPVRGVYHTGASTWPGPGVTGMPGKLAAERVLGDARVGGRLVRRTLAAAGGRGRDGRR